MAITPKSKSRKPDVKGKPPAAPAAVAKPTPKPAAAKPAVKAAPKPVTVKAKTVPVASHPVVAPPVAIKPAAEPVSAAVEWPVENAPEISTPVIETEPTSVIPEPATPEPTTVIDIPPVAAITKKGPEIMTDMLETAKTYSEEAKTRFQSAFAEANEKTKAAMEKSTKAFEELGELTKGNLEAVVESSKIAAKGVETMGQDAAEFGRKSFEKTSATMKSFAAVKTPAEFFQLQSDLLSATMDSFASEASKNSEAFLKLASDISAPISNRVSIVTEKMKALAA